MTLYMAIPKTGHDVVEVATGTSLKTVLQVATPSGTDIRPKAWGISFDGVASDDPPGKVELIETDVAATSLTGVTPEEWRSVNSSASACVSGTSATGYGAGAEGTITASVIRDAQNVHPQTGYSLWWPEGVNFRVGVSRFLRIRCTFSVTINCIPWIIWEEPA